MSLADLAAGIVTRAAVHLYETGRARPSEPVLSALAGRLGRTVEDFLADAPPTEVGRDLARELMALVRYVERLARSTDLIESQRETLREVGSTLRRCSAMAAAATRDLSAGDQAGRLGGREDASPIDPIL